jgi:tripartite-type tricarboxylate transporter receptor subunit TctC
MATSPALYRNMPYKTLDDFEYVGMVNEVPMTLIGKPGLPASNMAELRKWMDANKGKINLANAGLGAASHLCGLLFQQSVGIDMTTVPYKGTAPAMTDLLGGQVDLLCDQTTNTTSQIEGGKVKAFAVTSPKRLTTPALAKLPTLDESGLKGFNVTIWHGMYAPKGTPKAALDQINAALKAALKDPEFVKHQEALGAVIINDNRNNPADHKKFVEAEIAKWGPVIKAAGQYAD